MDNSWKDLHSLSARGEIKAGTQAIYGLKEEFVKEWVQAGREDKGEA